MLGLLTVFDLVSLVVRATAPFANQHGAVSAVYVGVEPSRFLTAAPYTLLCTRVELGWGREWARFERRYLDLLQARQDTLCLSIHVCCCFDVVPCRRSLNASG